MRDAVNIRAVQLVAEGLRELRHEVVFVGGAVISLYADDPGADTPRPTSDIDLVIKVVGYAAYTRLEQRLAELGFHHSPEDAINCRHRFHGVVVDIMPTDVPALIPISFLFMAVGLPSAKVSGNPISLRGKPDRQVGKAFAWLKGVFCA